MRLEELRKEIDSIDNEIINLLSKRNFLAKEIAAIKKGLNKPVLDKKRENELLGRIKKIANEKNLDENFICSIYEIILKMSRNQQENA